MSLRRFGLSCLSRAGGGLVRVRSGCTGEVAPEGVGEVNGEEGCVVFAGSPGSIGTVLKPGSSSSMPVSSSRDEAVFGVAGEATSVRGVPKAPSAWVPECAGDLGRSATEDEGGSSPASRGEDGASGGGAR